MEGHLYSRLAERSPGEKPMAKTSGSELQRIIAALKRRDPVADSAKKMLDFPRRLIRRGRDEESLRQSLEKAGLDFDEIKKINKKLRRGQLDRLRAQEKRSNQDEESVSEAKKVLHGWVEEQRRNADWIAVHNPPSKP